MKLLGKTTTLNVKRITKTCLFQTNKDLMLKKKKCKIIHLKQNKKENKIQLIIFVVNKSM